MRKNKEAYMNFVCPYCWNTLNKCVCKVFPPYHLIFIDRNIQRHIRVLNEKGYRTTACCEAHKDICYSTYINFANDYFKDMTAPDGFQFDKNGRMISYKYQPKMTAEEIEELKKEKLEILLAWCKSLPDRNMEN